MSLLTELNNDVVQLIYKYSAPNGAGRFTDYCCLKAVIRTRLTRDSK